MDLSEFHEVGFDFLFVFSRVFFQKWSCRENERGGEGCSSCCSSATEKKRELE